MKRAAVFFDRDNTLIANDGYLGDPNGVKLVDGAAQAVARARELGYAVVVFSNQSGVARGMFGEEAVHAVNGRLDELLLDGNAGAVVDRHEFCPFHPEATVEAYRQDSPLRKPRPGMIVQAAEKLALDLSRSWAVGDAPRDVEAGHAAGCRTILVNDPTLPPSPAANSASDVEPDFVVSSLREAVDVIARETMGGERVEETSGGANSTEVATPAAGPDAASQGAMKITPASEATPARPTREQAPVAAASTVAPTPAPAGERKPAPRLASDVPEAPVTRESPRLHAGAAAYSAPPAPSPAAVQAARLESPSSAASLERVEELGEEILAELRRQSENPVADFSVSKLMAGIVQVIALAALFMAYFRKDTALLATLLVALTLQCFTIALLIMGRQR